VTERTKPRPLVSLVVAMAENGVIGNANRLPWHLPADLRHFKSVTWGKPLLMGRKTFDSIGKALPGRRNLVLTRNREFQAEGVEVVASLDEALAATRNDEELMVIGGAEIFRKVLPIADRMYVTRVHAAIAGDTRFPAVDWNAWKCLSRSQQRADEKNAHDLTFLVLEQDAVQRSPGH
jgi:dihydrofolate reductase